MPKHIFATCMLILWSAGAHAGAVVLDCATPDNMHYTDRINALVERDTTSITVRTELWEGKWYIKRQGVQGFRAELATAKVKPGGSYTGERELLLDLQKMAISMTGPQGGFIAGKRYSCALTLEDNLTAGSATRA